MTMQKFAWPMASMMIVLSMLGCTPKVKGPAGPSEDGASSAQIPEGLSAVEFGIGDVETSLLLGLTISEDGDLTNVEIEEKETTKYEVALVNVKVRKPYPKRLIVNLEIGALDDFAGHAVQIVPHIYVDKVDIEMDGFVYGGSATVRRRDIRIDVLEHLKEDASTTLIRAELELRLFLNTDASEVTPETPPTPLTQTVTSLSNPVRIDFLP